MPNGEIHDETPSPSDSDFNDSLDSGCGNETFTESDERSVCECLGNSIQRMADAQEYIATLLNERLNVPCNSIDDCAEKILAAIRSRIEGPLYDVSECQRLLISGMGGTLEYAVRCAHNIADQCDRECSVSDPDSEGRCCKTCGNEHCICEAGECVPAEPQENEPQADKLFIAYCNPSTNVAIALPVGEAPPIGYVQVAVSQSESAAMQLGQSACSQQQTPQHIGKLELPPMPTGFACDLPPLFGSSSKFSSSAALNSFFTDLLGQFGASIKSPTVNFFGVPQGLKTIATAGIKEFVEGVLEISSMFTLPIQRLIGCDSQRWSSAFSIVAVADILERWLGSSFGQVVQPFRYAVNLECPQTHLDGTQAVTTFLGNELSAEDLRTLWKMNGLCDTNLDDYVNAIRRKPEVLQLAIMRHRDIIDVNTYNQKMRELGFLDPVDGENIYEVTKQVPPISDIIRFMVRDADDETLVSRFGLDTEFTNKYRSQLKRWSADQGIPELYAQYAWRSHWQIPSPGQLFEFYHRLRYNPKFGGQAKMLDDIKAALIQQDILPYWHDYYLAVSFRPMRLRDLRRSFEVGSLSDQELLDGYIQLGYSDETAKLIAAYNTRLRDNALINSAPVKQWTRFLRDRNSTVAALRADGFPDAAIDRAIERATPKIATSDQAKAFIKGLLNRQQFSQMLINQGVAPADVTTLVETLSVRRVKHDAVGKYATGRIGRGEATQTMIADGMHPAIVSAIIATVDDNVLESLVVSCQRAIKRRFVMGEIDQQQAINELVARGTVADRAALLVEWWGCELKSGRREVSAAKLCDWLARGVINPIQYIARLVQIGYARLDAELMLADCLTAANEKRLREAAKAAKDQAANAERLARRADMSAAKVERERAKMKALSERKAKLKLSREKAMYSIIDKLNGKLSGSLPDIAHFVSNQVDRLDRQFALSQDQALQVLTVAANEFGGKTQAEFIDVANAIAETTVTADLSDKPKEIFIPDSNGSV